MSLTPYGERSRGRPAPRDFVPEVAAAEIARAGVGADVADMFPPPRLTAVAPRLGLRPGFAVDLSEAKQHGRYRGEHWDLNQERDVEELSWLLARERPKLLLGCPP